MRRFVKIFSWALIALTILIFIYGIFNYFTLKSFLQEAVISYGLPAVFILVFFLDLFPQFLSGHNMILIAALLGDMNIYYVTFIVLIAAFFASVAGFWIGKKFEEGVFEDVFGEKVYEKIEDGMKKYGKWYVAISAVSPLPYIPLVFGGLDMDWKDFMIYGVIPRLLGFLVIAILVYHSLPFVLQYFRL